MSRIVYRDILYGEISFPEWLGPFLRIPELVRLRSVRLSNVDSIQYKDFGSATRYDHALGVAYLAGIVAQKRGLGESEAATLILAALLHDVGTPPFGHTLELVYDDLDHELEAWKALGLSDGKGKYSVGAAYRGQLPQFVERCLALKKLSRIAVDPQNVANLIVGSGDLGFLINGTLDLDNTDNVIRGAHYLGLGVGGSLAKEIATWLAGQKSPPIELHAIASGPAAEWWKLKNEYYRFFFETSTEESGRQAHLQFLAREAIRLGIARERIIRATDEEFLQRIEEFATTLSGSGGEILFDQVRRYRILDQPELVNVIDIDNPKDVRTLNVRTAISWMEKELRRPGFLPALFLTKRRFDPGASSTQGLFDAPLAKLYVFALYKPKSDRTSSVAQDHMPALAFGGQRLLRDLGAYTSDKFSVWLDEKPWKEITQRNEESITESLNSWGDWGFISSRNEPLHPYPSTFVHAIPSSLLKSLRLSGTVVLDPFSGTSQTGIEAIKAGASAICCDVNEVALLISRNRFVYHDDTTRTKLRQITPDVLRSSTLAAAPNVSNIGKWHHINTIKELCLIKGYIEAQDDEQIQSFLLLCLSAILGHTTARRGKQHGRFADNTPLPIGMDEPPYCEAFVLFCDRIEHNLRILEGDYAKFERRGVVPNEAYKQVSVKRVNASTATTADYGVKSGTVGAIITSPPYLCMSDYTLGQRLSYYWIYPDLLDRDFNEESGARRKRTRPEHIAEQYMTDQKNFAAMAYDAITKNGFVALVLGAPQARAYQSRDIYSDIEAAFCENGLSLIWSHWRPITWHRNHGYERLKKEKILVFAKKK